MTPPLSPFRRAAGLVFLSGEVPIGPGGAVPEGIEAQTELVIGKITATLAGLGLMLGDVVSVNAYLTDPGHFAAFNAVYARQFPQPYPVRTTVTAALMLPSLLVELQVVAADPSN
ncbi:RidA family protein [Roseomonas sp. GCM10028921]